MQDRATPRPMAMDGSHNYKQTVIHRAPPRLMTRPGTQDREQMAREAHGKLPSLTLRGNGPVTTRHGRLGIVLRRQRLVGTLRVAMEPHGRPTIAMQVRHCDDHQKSTMSGSIIEKNPTGMETLVVGTSVIGVIRKSITGRTLSRSTECGRTTRHCPK